MAQAPLQTSSNRARAWWVIGIVLLGTAGLGWRYVIWPTEASELRKVLERRGDLLAVYSEDTYGELPQVAGTRFASAQVSRSLIPLLSDSSANKFVQGLRSAKLDGVLLSLPPSSRYPKGSVGAQLSSYGIVEGLVGTYLSKDLALYSVDHAAELPPRFGTVLAQVARRLLRGESPPRLRSFPALLRKVQHVEVMVLLRAGPRARLWRSARGSSIARAFLTATRVARRRWQEREQSMGEPLEDALPKLTVEIALLMEDGEIGTREAKFIDRVVSEQHGIAYEHKGGWRYLLPDATHEHGEGSATRALSKLLEDNGLSAESYKDPLIRVTRLRVESLAVSPPTFEGAEEDPLASPRDPGELLEPE